MAHTNASVAAAFIRGNAAKGSNLYSTGSMLQSYNTTVAIHSGPFILVSADRMSPTTGRHLSRVYGGNVLHVNQFSWGRKFTTPPAPESVVVDLMAQAVELARQGNRARQRKHGYFAEAARRVDQARAYAAHFHVPVHYPSDLRDACALANINLMD